MCWSNLRACLDEIEAQNKNLWLWVRDDDVTVRSEALIKMLDYFKAKGLPLLLAVIPEKCCISDIKKMISENKISIGQHGYSHENYLIDDYKCSELNADRGIEIILKEQLLGNELLEKEFGNKYQHIFVPPWFEIDKNVYQVLKKYYCAFSIWGSNDNNNMVEINSQVDFIDWSNDGIYSGDKFILSQIIRECESLIRNDAASLAAIGIVLHHEYYQEEWYDFLDHLFAELSRYRNVSYPSCNDLIDFVSSQEFVKLNFHMKKEDGN